MKNQQQAPLLQQLKEAFLAFFEIYMLPLLEVAAAAEAVKVLVAIVLEFLMDL